MISVLTPFAASVHTPTTDNSKEFAQRKHIAAELDADFFFANPYASFERGANENMNWPDSPVLPEEHVLRFHYS